jgi:hypothetical protein
MDKIEKNAKELAKVSEALETYISKGDNIVDDISESRGQSAPQAFKKSIADIQEEQMATVSDKEMKALKDLILQLKQENLKKTLNINLSNY